MVSDITILPTISKYHIFGGYGPKVRVNPRQSNPAVNQIRCIKNEEIDEDYVEGLEELDTFLTTESMQREIFLSIFFYIFIELLCCCSVVGCHL